MKPDGRKNNKGEHLKKEPFEKKKQITIYEIPKEIEELGGMDVVRKLLRTAFNEALEQKRKTDRYYRDVPRQSDRPLNANSAA